MNAPGQENIAKTLLVSYYTIIIVSAIHSEKNLHNYSPSAPPSALNEAVVPAVKSKHTDVFPVLTKFAIQKENRRFMK